MDDLEKRFSYYEIPEGSANNDVVQDMFLRFAIRLDNIIPAGRDKALMLTKLEEAWDRADRALDPREVTE